eukprot:5768222-Prymnesium_polylepis.2
MGSTPLRGMHVLSTLMLVTAALSASEGPPPPWVGHLARTAADLKSMVANHSVSVIALFDNVDEAFCLDSETLVVDRNLTIFSAHILGTSRPAIRSIGSRAIRDPR